MIALLACETPTPAGPSAPATIDVSGNRLAVDAPGYGSALLEATALGTGEMIVTLRLEGGDLVPRVLAEEAATLTGVVLTGDYVLEDEGDAVHWRQGYQSWSWSGVTALVEPELDAAGLPTVAGDGDVVTITQETPWSSWWVGLVGRPQGPSLLFGALSAKKTKFWTAVSPTKFWAVWGGRGESIALAPEQAIDLDPAWVSFGDSRLHETWAGRVTAASRVDAPPPVGWSDWYRYYGAATETEIRANLAVAAPPIEVFQVDDGWQQEWGDWAAGADFPSGTEELAGDIADAGFTPGLWMAPFYVSRTSATYAAHDDWWVKDASGEELAHGSLDGKDLAILDVTVPEAAEWLEGVVEEKSREGWGYLKLDFLFAGAVEGVRGDDVTGMEAYALGMEILRDAVGDGWMLACGAPMLPTVGYAESWRSGNDIALATSPAPDRAWLRWEARNSAARAFANGRFWWNDPDAILVGDWDAVQTSGAVATAVATGGSWFIGDALTELTEAQRAVVLDPELAELRGQFVVPVDALDAVSGFDAGPFVEASTPDDAVPLTWQLRDGTTVLLNLGDTPVEIAATDTPPLLGDGDETLAAGEGEIR